MDHKTCYTCQQSKHTSEFYKDKQKKDGLRPNCKTCSSKEQSRDQKLKSQRLWRAKNPKKVKNIHLKKYYGLTLDGYESRLEQQNHKCCICKKDQQSFTRKFAVDHCHRTGKVRGLLCSKCNTAIGLLQEDLTVIESAYVYIKTNKEVNNETAA